MASFPWRLTLVFGLAAGCAPASPVTPAPEPSQPPAEVIARSPEATPAGRPADHPPVSDSVQAERDSLLDAAVLEQLAEAHAPPPAVTQAGDPLDALAAGTASLDVTTYADHDRVRYYLDFFQGPARSRMEIWLGRLPVYESMIRRRFAAAGLPADLVYLGLIESGYSNVAVSRSRAVGMWQFMRGTGRWMGLRIDRWVDERRDPVKATDAAARYLVKLSEQFGSYYLAAAAYNGGPGTVSRGLGRLDLGGGGDGTAGEEETDGELEYTDEHFFTLADSRYLRQETKDYVPKLIAATLIARDPMAYGFEPVPVGPPYPSDSVVVPGMTSLGVIAGLAGVPVEAIVELNPHYLRKVTPPGTTSVVRLPAGTMDSVAARVAAMPPAERANFREHTVRKGETLSGIGRKYGVSVSALREANPELRRSGPRAGQQLVIPVGAATRWADVDDRPARGGTHTVRRGETLSGIAKRYGVTTAQLRSWNGLSSSNIRAGQKLKVGGRAASQAARPSDRLTTYTVRRGDTLSGIARRYGTTVQDLQRTNNLSSARALKAGQKLRIPS